MMKLSKIAESVDYATMKTLGGKYELTNVAIRNGFYSRIWEVYRNDLEWENRDDIKGFAKSRSVVLLLQLNTKTVSNLVL